MVDILPIAATAVRLGLPTSFKKLSAVCRTIGAPMLVSANVFWRFGRFRRPGSELFARGDVALDSAGFVAMSKWGGYPWSVADYVSLAGSYPWAWWASMDFCCEPQIAADRKAVSARVKLTADYLEHCRLEAARQGVSAPMPVLQGWRPDDYLECANRMVALPALIGIGSVCRRQIGGPDGLAAVIGALDAALPTEVRFHLFGVKGTALAELGPCGRIASIDSMAWDFDARFAKRGPCTLEHRISTMTGWYSRATSACPA